MDVYVVSVGGHQVAEEGHLEKREAEDVNFLEKAGLLCPCECLWGLGGMGERGGEGAREGQRGHRRDCVKTAGLVKMSPLTTDR